MSDFSHMYSEDLLSVHYVTFAFSSRELGFISYSWAVLGELSFQNLSLYSSMQQGWNKTCHSDMTMWF
jgi:hypothetical protein